MNKMKKFLALFLVLGLLLVSVAVPASADAGTPDYPNTASFSWGINGHATGSYGSVSVADQIALAAKLGAKLYRVDISDTSELGSVDPIVMAANTYGMDVMLCCTVPTNLTAEAIGAKFTAIASHYNIGDFGRVKYIEIFNETEGLCKISDDADSCSAAGYDSAKIADMAAKMGAAAAAVKAVSTDYLTVVNYGYLHDPYLSLLVDAGLSFDVIDLHWYTGMETDRSAQGGLNEALSRLNDDTNLASKPVILGETGVLSNSAGIKGSNVMTAELETIMSKAYASEKVIGAIFYELLDNVDGFGFVNYDSTDGLGEVKPIYTSVQALIGGSNNVTPSAYVYSENYPATANCTYNNPLQTGASIDFTFNGTGWGESYRSYFTATDIKKYDYIEFDAYVEKGTSDSDSGQLLIKIGSSGSNCYAQKDRVFPAYGEWQHFAIQLNDTYFQNYDAVLTAINNVYIGAVLPGQTAHIRNVCFTKFAPEAEYVYNSPLSAGVSLAFSHASWGEGGLKNLATPVQLNTYDYVEYDVYVTEYTSPVVKYGIKFKDSAGNVAQLNTNKYDNNRTTVAALGKWEHVVIPVSDFTANNRTVNQVYVAATYNTVNIANLAFTKFAPEAEYVYNSPLSAGVSLAFSYDGWGEGGLKNLATPVQLNTYDYVEYDVYVTEYTSPVVKYGIKFKDSAGNVAQLNTNKYDNNRTTVAALGKWEHVVIPVSDFTANNRTVNQVYVAATYNTVNIANLAFTKFAPEAEYVYNSPLSAGVSLAYSYDGWGEGGLKNLATPVQLNTYDYVEYDVYVTEYTSPVVKYGIKFKDSTGNVAQLNTNKYTQNRTTVAELGKWEHVVIPVSDFTANNRTVNQVYVAATYNTVNIANLAFTKFAVPEVNNTYALISTVVPDVIEQVGDLKTHFVKYAQDIDSWIADKAMVDATDAEYFEFDVFAKSSNNTVNLGDLKIFADGTTAAWLLKSAITVDANKWVHVVLPMSEFVLQKKQGFEDRTVNLEHISNISIENGNSTCYSVVNTCFTKEEEIIETVWGDANGDGKINLKDLLCIKKAIANEEKIDNCDIDDDGDLTIEDANYLCQYLLGKIDSLDPKDLDL